MSLAPLRLPLSWDECGDDTECDDTECDDTECDDTECDDTEFGVNEFGVNEFDDNECHENVTGRIGERGVQFAKRFHEQEQQYQDMLVSIVDFSGKSFKLLKSVLAENECERRWENMKEEVKECIKEELITEVKNVNKYWFYKPSERVMKLLVNKVLINLLYECQYQCEYKYEDRIERLKNETKVDNNIYLSL
jgi:hypothetical protein